MHGGKLDLGQSPWYHIRARIFKQVQPVVITTQQHQCSNLAIGYDCLKSFTQCTHPGVYVCYYEESDFCSLLYCMTSWSILPKYYCTGLVYYIIILLYYYQLWYYDITMFIIHQDEGSCRINKDCWRPNCESHCVKIYSIAIYSIQPEYTGECQSCLLLIYFMKGPTEYSVCIYLSNDYFIFSFPSSSPLVRLPGNHYHTSIQVKSSSPLLQMYCQMSSI